MASSTEYFPMTKQGVVVEEDKVGLLPAGGQGYIRFMPKPWPLWKKALATLGTLLLALLLFAGGMLLQWRATPLPSRRAASEAKNSTELLLASLAPPSKFIQPGLRGTNANSEFINNSPGFNLVRPNAAQFEAGRLNPQATIFLPGGTPPGCVYEFQPQLGFDGSAPKGVLLNPGVPLRRDDILQVNVGDCGLGAAVLAIIAAGMGEQLERRLVRPAGAAFLQATFDVPGLSSAALPGRTVRTTTPVTLRIDDALPVARAGTGCSASHLGFVGSTGPPPVLFMPLLEKAVAKFLDLHPEFRVADGFGYAGLEGIRPAKAIAALTGFESREVSRKKPEFDDDITLALFNCIQLAMPCVVATTNALTLAGLGNGVPQTAPGTTGVIVSGDAGVLATTSNPAYYFVIDPVAPVAKARAWVGNHAYAIDHEKTPRIDGEEVTLENAVVTLRNPWGFNPVATNVEVIEPDGTFEISFKALAISVDSVGFGSPFID
ncbi:hypothetical protein EJ06DRAFT_559760 [Trichodelitschia bisporula]|uniref:Calpain catalytic domain-containing protein n=1 Tax=Trichodelitschia bisporula TaxID=703511 RepID=A0A6G1HKQ6_9PEZI|nr:hypothetical protein EJ06DRAFT_559760 [Trichodelitschia bisporula]